MDSVRSGDALLQLAREHCLNFAALLKEGRQLGPDRTVTIGTGCTGSAADTLVSDAMEEAYREYLPDISFRYIFNREINDKIREWIVKLHNALAHDGSTDSVQVPCMFGDVIELGASEAYCHVHEKNAWFLRWIFSCVARHVRIPASKTPNECQVSCRNRHPHPGALPRR